MVRSAKHPHVKTSDYLKRLVSAPARIVRRAMIVRRVEVFTFSTAQSSGRGQSCLPDGQVFGKISERHILSGKVFDQNARRDRFLARLEEGHKCFGFFDEGGDVGAYFWVSFGRDVAVPFEGGLTAIVPDSALYVWDCFTGEGYRRQGLYWCGLKSIQRLAVDLAKSTVCIAARATNAASINGIRKAGFEVSDSLGILSLLGNQFVLHSNGSVQLILAGRRYRLPCVMDKTTGGYGN